MNEMSVSTFANVCLQLNKDVVFASGTQYQVCENATKIIQRLKGLWFSIYTYSYNMFTTCLNINIIC